MTRASALSLRTGWVTSPGWDLVWMFSALWASLALLAGNLVLATGSLAATVFVANRGIALAHSWSTSYMVLASPLLAEQRDRDRTRYLYWPIVIVVLSFAAGIGLAYVCLSDGVATIEQSWIWTVYIGLFWVGHFWHFGAQDFGVLSLYRIKAGQTRARDRVVDKVFTMVMMYAIQPIVFLYAFKTGPLTDTLGALIPVSQAWATAAAPVAIGIAVTLSSAVILLELTKANASIPKLLYYFVIALHPTLLYYFEGAAQNIFIVAYLWSHWFIAIGLVSKINSGYYEKVGKSRSQALLSHAATLGAIVLVVSAATYRYDYLNLFSRLDYRISLAGISSVALAGGLLGFFLAEQLLHYYCDRCLFRFRDPEIRQTVGPLL